MPRRPVDTGSTITPICASPLPGAPHTLCRALVARIGDRCPMHAGGIAVSGTVAQVIGALSDLRDAGVLPPSARLRPFIVQVDLP